MLLALLATTLLLSPLSLSNPLSILRRAPLAALSAPDSASQLAQHLSLLSARQVNANDPKKKPTHSGPVVYLTDCDVPVPSKRYSLITYYPDHVNRASPITSSDRRPTHQCRVSNSTWVNWGSKVTWDCFEGQGTPADVFSFESDMEVTSGDYAGWAGSGKAGGREGAGKGYTCWKDDHRVLFEDKDGADDMQCYSGYYCYY